MMDGTVTSCHTTQEWNKFSKKAFRSGHLVVVDFTSAGIGPCRYLDPIVDKLANKMPHVIFFKVEVNELVDVAKGLKIEGIPTVLVFKQGKEIERILGPTKGELVAKIAEIDMMQPNGGYETGQNLGPTKEALGVRVTELEVLSPNDLFKWYTEFTGYKASDLELLKASSGSRRYLWIALFCVIAIVVAIGLHIY